MLLSFSNRSIPESDAFFCKAVRAETPGRGKMLTTIATLKTSKTHLMVSDGQWPKPTEVISKLDTPTMSLLMYGPGYCAEGAFLDGTARKLSRRPFRRSNAPGGPLPTRGG